MNTNSKPLLEYTYDDFGRLSELVLLGAYRENYTWSEEGHLIEISGRDIEATSFSYESDGLLSRVKYPEGSIFRYEYDAARRLTKVTYPDSGEVAFSYDMRGRLHAIRARDAEFSFKWEDSGLLGLARFSNGAHSHEVRCSDSRRSATLGFTRGEKNDTVTSILGLWSRRGGGSSSEMFAFPGERLVGKLDVGGAGVVTWSGSGRRSCRFDQHNCLTSVINADGTGTLFRRLMAQRAVLKVAASGVSILQYDADGLLRSERDAQGIGVAYASGCHGDLESIVREGRRLNIVWDVERNVQSMSVDAEFRAVFKNEDHWPARLVLERLQIPLEVAMESVVTLVWSWQANRPIQRLVDLAFSEN